jgi:SAM-dependent methyltransferase
VPAQDLGWSVFYRRWTFLEPPLRPPSEVCEALRTLTAGFSDRVLLLGVTPELSAIGGRVVAVDRSDTSLAFIWPGNRPGRRAVRGDWAQLPCADGSMSAALGDGSLNCVDYPCGFTRVLGELARVLRRGGRLVVRLYTSPDDAESMASIRARTMNGEVANIHALKWRLAQAIGAGRDQPNVPVRSILHAFNRQFPDRQALGRATGWSDFAIRQIDEYANLGDVFSFPTARQVLTALPTGFVNPRLVAAGTYPLAERCPLLVAEVNV